jgi:hypothetical protein
VDDTTFMCRLHGMPCAKIGYLGLTAGVAPFRVSLCASFLVWLPSNGTWARWA